MPASQPRPFSLASLLTAQFFGAFNDNAFKMIVVLLGLAAVDGQGEVEKQGVTTLAMIVLTAPLMLGSLPAMVVGDRVSKRSLIVWTKLAELLLMALGTYALWAQPQGWLPYVVLGGMGLQSALFAPGKYGLLPEVLPHERLTAANGKLEAASFLAIILGTVAGGLLLENVGDYVWVAGLILTTLSSIGFAFSCLKIKPAAASILALSVLFVDWVLQMLPFMAPYREHLLTFRMSNWIYVLEENVSWAKLAESYTFLFGLNLTLFVLGWMAFQVRDFKT